MKLQVQGAGAGGHRRHKDAYPPLLSLRTSGVPVSCTKLRAQVIRQDKVTGMETRLNSGPPLPILSIRRQPFDVPVKSDEVLAENRLHCRYWGDVPIEVKTILIQLHNDDSKAAVVKRVSKGPGIKRTKPAVIPKRSESRCDWLGSSAQASVS